jgi:hypothetical protein
MNLAEAMKQVESHEFAARLNVTSDFPTFLRGAHDAPPVRSLFGAVNARGSRQRLFSRILELARQRVDPRYENPWDTPLTIYLWILGSTDWNVAKAAAEVIATIPQCWWATKLSRYFLLRGQFHSNATLERYELALTYSRPTAVSKAEGAGEVILSGGFLLDFDGVKATEVVPVNCNSLAAPSVTEEWGREPRTYKSVSQGSESMSLVA